MDSVTPTTLGAAAPQPTMPTIQTKHPLPMPPPAPKETVDDPELSQLSSMLTNFNWQGDEVEACAKTICDPMTTENAKYRAIMQLKQLLCTSRANVFKVAQDVIDSGVLKGLVVLVSSSSPYDSLRHPAAFCLTNVAAGSDEQTAAVVQAGAIPVLVEALRSNEEVLRRQAIFCLANVAGATAEFRQQLATYPDYFSSIVHSFLFATDPRVEELAGWNVRNMIVLGGPTLDQLSVGIDFFALQLQRHISLELCAKRVANGSASMAVAIEGTSAHIDHTFNTTLLRFATEAFSCLSKTPEGRQVIIDRELQLILLYHAKFSNHHSIRNNALEALGNLAQLGTNSARASLLHLGALVALGELLADYITYSPHQRVLAAKTLFYLCSHCYMEINTMAEPRILTVDAAKRWLAQRRTFFPGGLRGGVLPIDLEVEYELGNGGGGPNEENNATQDGGSGDANGQNPAARPQLTSGLDIAYSIFMQSDRLEELALREKCGRLIITCLTQMSEQYVLNAISPSTIDLVFNILEMAIEMDAMAGVLGNNQGPNAVVRVSAMEALTPGEPGLPPGAFVQSCLALLERLLVIGDKLLEAGKAVENPIAALMIQEGGVQRLEGAVGRAPLPFELMEKTMELSQRYLR